MKNKVLLVNHNNSYFMGLYQTAILLINSRRYRPTILFSKSYPTLTADVQKLQYSGINYLFDPEVELDCSIESGHTDLKVEIRQKSIIDIMKQSPIGSVLRKIRHRAKLTTVGCMRSLHRQERFIRMIIRDLQISLIILPSDNRYDQAIYVHAAKKEGISSVVVPQFVVGPLEWAEYVLDQPDYWVSSLSNWLVSVIYPHWGYNHRGKKLVALPSSQVIARELLGIAPPLPWVLHSGSADAIALESEAAREFCIAEGMHAPQFFVTGSVTHDVMSCILKDCIAKTLELWDEYGLISDHPLIVSALPPDVLYQNRPDCEFKAYSELIEFWCRSLASVSHGNTIICLHPSVTYDDFKYIETWGVKISKKPTFEMIPLCDIFVASVSATIQWAIACGKPVLNYDVYRYGYHDYDCVKGVIKVKDKEEFLEKLHRLVKDSIFCDQISASQSADSKDWGRLDGKAGNRLIKLFDELVDRRFGIQTDSGQL